MSRDLSVLPGRLSSALSYPPAASGWSRHSSEEWTISCKSPKDERIQLEIKDALEPMHSKMMAELNHVLTLTFTFPPPVETLEKK